MRRRWLRFRRSLADWLVGIAEIAARHTRPLYYPATERNYNVDFANWMLHFANAGTAAMAWTEGAPCILNGRTLLDARSSGDPITSTRMDGDRDRPLARPGPKQSETAQPRRLLGGVLRVCFRLRRSQSPCPSPRDLAADELHRFRVRFDRTSLGTEHVFRYNSDIWQDYKVRITEDVIELENSAGRCITDADIAKVYCRSNSPGVRGLSLLRMSTEDRYLEEEIGRRSNDVVNILRGGRGKWCFCSRTRRCAARKLQQLRMARKHFAVTPSQFLVNFPGAGFAPAWIRGKELQFQGSVGRRVLFRRSERTNSIRHVRGS